jgi:hypothetical protein
MLKREFFTLWTTGKGLYVLLGVLFFGIFMSPLLIASGLISDILIEVIFALILIAGVFTTPCGTFLRLGLLVIVFLSVAARILDKFNRHDFTIVGADNVLAAISLVAFTILIINHFLLGNVLLRYRIAAAVAVYLILGVLWARLYELVYLFNPNAFTLNEKIDPFSLIYFSFVTLVTLGYGDIVPLSIGVRSLAILEGVVGQLYLVIMISTLVSEFSAVKVKFSKDLN